MGALRLALAGLVAASVSGATAPAEGKQRGGGEQVLLFSHTSGYRHASIEPGIVAIRAIGAREGITVVASEDPAIFNPGALNNYDAIIFLSSTTDPRRPETEWLTGTRRAALQDFVRKGGGVVGIHAAADSHSGWDWYGRLIGARFLRHPDGIANGRLRVTDPAHPATRGLPGVVEHTDEWYYFDDYNPEARLLLTLDPRSIGEKDVNPNPISWAHDFEGGRVFYTALGHTPESFRDREFLTHLSGGLRWVLRKG